MLLLHSFEYTPAAEAFRQAQEADPDFALAYWGEAMTHNHPLWREHDRDLALAALERLAPTPEERRAKTPTEREKMYLDAVETLYSDEYADESAKTGPRPCLHGDHGCSPTGVSRGRRGQIVLRPFGPGQRRRES